LTKSITNRGKSHIQQRGNTELSMKIKRERERKRRREKRKR
jgi:hypothetical protein